MRHLSRYQSTMIIEPVDPCLYTNIYFRPSVILSTSRLIPYLPEQARLLNFQASTQRVCAPRKTLNTGPLRVAPKTATHLPLSIQVEAKDGSEVARSGRAINVLQTEVTEPLC